MTCCVVACAAQQHRRTEAAEGARPSPTSGELASAALDRPSEWSSERYAELVMYTGAGLAAAGRDEELDRAVAQRIRETFVADDVLSGAAENVQIISADEVVILRGTVRSEREREAMMAAAQRVAGDGRVRDQLVVRQ